MLSNSERQTHIIPMPEQLWHAPLSTGDLMTLAVREMCTRTPSLRADPKAQHIQQLIKCGAWTDAVLALIELDLPDWKLRRITYEDGEWHCSLSQNPAIPIEFDETAEAVHENLSLAMLGAFIAARNQLMNSAEVNASSELQNSPSEWQAICCDNFA